NGGFKNCGNGVIDGNEECDDGNLDDDDACLSTCEPNVCGDGFVDLGVEQCDLGLPAALTCERLGFATGTLACTDACTLDTSGCSGQAPTPTATPTSGPSGETPSPG